MAHCQWNIKGAEGKTSLGGNFKRAWRSGMGSELILAEIFIRGEWSDRASAKMSYFDAEDFTVKLSQVVMMRQRLEELVEELGHWLDSPHPISKSFCPHRQEQDMVLAIISPDHHNKLEKPVLEVEYSAAAFAKAKWSFDVDPSCIQAFADELRAALEQFGRSA